MSLHLVFFLQFNVNTRSAFKKNQHVLNIEFTSQSIQKTVVTQTKPKTTETTPSNTKITPIRKTKIPVPTKSKEKPTLKTEEKETPKEIQQPVQTNNDSNLYLQKVITAIESNKFYPSSARRRNMQEMIHVSFNLLASGEVEKIQTLGKYKLLQLAAKTAILESLPFEKPPGDINFPLRVNYAMSFKLN